MKAKLFYACLFIMFAAGVLGSSSVQREEPVDALFLENVEALAHYEYDPMCPNGCVMVVFVAYGILKYDFYETGVSRFAIPFAVYFLFHRNRCG